MSLNEYEKSILALNDICKSGQTFRKDQVRYIRGHLEKLLTEVEERIVSRNFQELGQFLECLSSFDRSFNFCQIFGDYKYSYFVNINSAYVVQQ